MSIKALLTPVILFSYKTVRQTCEAGSFSVSAPAFFRVPGGAAVGGGDARQAVGPVEGAVGAEGGAGGGGGRVDRGGGGGGAVALVRLQPERGEETTAMVGTAT